MHRRLIELVELLDETRKRLTEAVEQADPERIEKGPAEGKWSVAEVVDHLSIVEGNVAGLIVKLVDRARLSLGKAIDHADGRALETLSFPHRYFGPLDLYQWILLIAHHEERHRQQILAMRRHDEILPI